MHSTRLQHVDCTHGDNVPRTKHCDDCNRGALSAFCVCRRADVAPTALRFQWVEHSHGRRLCYPWPSEAYRAVRHVSTRWGGSSSTDNGQLHAVQHASRWMRHVRHLIAAPPSANLLSYGHTLACESRASVAEHRNNHVRQLRRQRRVVDLRSKPRSVRYKRQQAIATESWLPVPPGTSTLPARLIFRWSVVHGQEPLIPCMTHYQWPVAGRWARSPWRPRRHCRTRRATRLPGAVRCVWRATPVFGAECVRASLSCGLPSPRQL